MSRRTKRPTQDYLASAKRLAKFAPSLKKYRRRKTLSPAEKAAIRRKENALRFADHLIPLNKKQYAQLRDYTPGPGIHAVQLRNTGSHTKINFVKDNMFVTSNGRTYLYWKLSRGDVKSKSGMKTAAQKAFDMQFPVEQIAELAHKAFEELEPIAVYLWAPAGRVGQGFASLRQFLTWLYENWNTGRYTNQEKWVNGIAILLHEGREETDEEYEDEE